MKNISWMILCVNCLYYCRVDTGIFLYTISPLDGFQVISLNPYINVRFQCSLVPAVISAGSQTFAWILLMLHQWMYYEIAKSLLWKVIDPNARHCKRNTAVLWVFFFTSWVWSSWSEPVAPESLSFTNAKSLIYSQPHRLGYPHRSEFWGPSCYW